MSVKVLSGSVAAAWLACGLAVGAQAPAYPKADQKSEPATATVTVAGCIQSEKSVLKRPAAAGDVGMGDEFVLTRATLKGGDTPSAGQPPADTQPPSSTVGTSGSAGPGKVYRLTGDKEKDLKAFAGQRVEITGAFKNPEDATRAVTGEPTPENTPEFTIEAIKPVQGSCSGGGQ
jgi:hypothetical protein